MEPLKQFGIRKDKYGRNMAYWTDPKLTKKYQESNDPIRGFSKKALVFSDTSNTSDASNPDVGTWGLYRVSGTNEALDKAGYYDTIRSKRELVKKVQRDNPNISILHMDDRNKYNDSINKLRARKMRESTSDITQTPSMPDYSIRGKDPAEDKWRRYTDAYKSIPKKDIRGYTDAFGHSRSYDHNDISTYPVRGKDINGKDVWWPR